MRLRRIFVRRVLRRILRIFVAANILSLRVDEPILNDDLNATGFDVKLIGLVLFVLYTIFPF